MGDYYHIAHKSMNKKTGPIVTTISSSSTCPDTCPFKVSGCYAKCGPMNIHWRNVDSGKYGLEFSEFVSTLRRIPRYANKSTLVSSGRSSRKKP